MGLLDFREDISHMRIYLRNTLASYDNCEGCDTFSKCVRELSQKFLPYFVKEERYNYSKNLIDIQAQLELIENDQRQIEKGFKLVYNVLFSVRALTMEMDKIDEALDILFTECNEFWISTKNMNSQNEKIIRILKEVWKIMKDINTAKYVLTKHQKEFIELNLENNLINFAESMSCSNSLKMNSLIKSLGRNTFYFAEALRQLKFLSDVIMHHHRLNIRHPVFSLYLIELVNHDVISAKALAKTNKFNCCKCFDKNDNIDEELKYSKSLIRCSQSTLQSIESNIVPIGIRIHSLNSELKQFHCAAIKRQEILLTAIQAKRLAYLRGLNELHNIMTAMEQLEEYNDTLVGKMTKARPKFEKVNDYLKIDLSALEQIINEADNQNN